MAALASLWFRLHRGCCPIVKHDVADSVEYRIEGSCERFWQYFGAEGCRVVTREAWEVDESAGL